MHDIRFIRENPDAFDAALGRRGIDPLAATILDIDTVGGQCRGSFRISSLVVMWRPKKLELVKGAAKMLTS